MPDLFAPPGKLLQGLTRRHWVRLDNPSEAVELFGRVQSILRQLRYGIYQKEYDKPFTDEEALEDLHRKLKDFANSYGKVGEIEMSKKYHLVPRAEGVTCEIFDWFVKQAEEGRQFFEEQGYNPDSFLSKADIELARNLSQETLWNDTLTVYRNHNFS